MTLVFDRFHGREVKLIVPSNSILVPRVDAVFHVHLGYEALTGLRFSARSVRKFQRSDRLKKSNMIFMGIFCKFIRISLFSGFPIHFSGMRMYESL